MHPIMRRGYCEIFVVGIVRNLGRACEIARLRGAVSLEEIICVPREMETSTVFNDDAKYALIFQRAVIIATVDEERYARTYTCNLNETETPQ